MRGNSFKIGLFAVILAAISYFYWPAEKPTIEQIETISSNEPIQEKTIASHILKTIDNETIIIDPVASYSIDAVIASKQRYYSGWQAELSPVDFALIWGDLVQPEHRQHISYSQSGRWYYYHYDSKGTLGQAYITAHSSNNHLIPATDNVRSGLLSAKENQSVHLEGYLVNVTGPKGYTWKSSTVRTDDGNGSCEVFYVTKAQIGSKLYR